MKLVENELTKQNVERARNNPELEKLQETEHKLTPKNPELLTTLFKAEANPIEQLYISSPHDEFSLRVRRIEKPSGTEYSTTLKSRGEIVNDALARSEIETAITEKDFNFYRDLDFPSLHKLRATIMEGVTIDFYDDPNEPVIVEVEHKDPEIRAYLLKVVQEMAGGDLVDRSDDPSLTNEAIAYKQYEQSGKTEHALDKPESLDEFTERIVAESVAHYVVGKEQVVVCITGMSGAGKTTVTHSLQERIAELFGEDYKPPIISTDDYHFGKTYLEATYGAPYTEWDDAKTYNTQQLAMDLEALSKGIAIPKRQFDFATEEPTENGVIERAPFVVVEGLYAGSNDLETIRDLHYKLPTGIATAVGRDVRRLVIDGRANRAFPTPQSRLKYQIQTALPKYLEQEIPKPKAFSASSRPLAARAFMLAELDKQ